MSEFFAMGGYAGYVWSSYGIAAVVLAANVVMPIMRHRAVVADIARKIRRARREQS